MDIWISLRVVGSILFVTSLGWEISPQCFYTKFGKSHKEGFTYLKLEAISPLQCAYYCIRDEACNSTSFNNDDGYCFLSTNILITPENEDTMGLNTPWIGIYRGCAKGWTEIGNTCFYISSAYTYKKFDKAQETCQKKGGKLAEPQTNETFELLRAHMQEYYSQNSEWKRWWIGLKDIDGSDTMVWISNGAEPQYTDWGEDEPQHYFHSLSKDCVYLKDAGGFHWKMFAR